MILANLATYPPRAEFLTNVVDAVSPQVDRLNIVLNEYKDIPEFLSEYTNVNAIIPDHDTKDAGKFFPDSSEAEYVFLIDDDVVYPHDFVALSLDRMRALGAGRYVGGYHCSIYRRPALFPISAKSLKANVRFWGWPSHIARFRKFFTFGHTTSNPIYVDQVATGAAVMRAREMPPYEFMKTSQKFVDVRLARWCFEQGIMRVNLPREKSWLRQCDSEGVIFEETISEDFTQKHHKHVAQEIRSFAFKDGRVGSPCP
jgi:hypothetical protein